MFEFITITIFFIAAPFALISLCHNSQQKENQVRQQIAARSINHNRH